MLLVRHTQEGGGVNDLLIEADLAQFGGLGRRHNCKLIVCSGLLDADG